MGDIAFEALAEPPRLRVADTVGNEQYELHLDSPVDPEPVSTEGFTHPVSEAVRVKVSGFEFDRLVRMHLWNEAGELLEFADHVNGFQVPSDEYYIETCQPLKTYIRLSGSVSVDREGERTQVRFGKPVTVDIGTRSPRKQPADTIVTTDAPTDMMRAVSCLGEGLMTTMPSRSFPNLRGYPPDIRLGDRLEIPDSVETGPQPVSLVLPPELSYLYEAAPLLYYLNANVRSGSSPRVEVNGDPVYTFDTSSFADDLENLLRHVFVLDCVVRSVGSYPLDSVECNRLDDVISFDLRELNEADEASRLRMYLDVPFEPVAREAPRWSARFYVEPSEIAVESIPHIATQLAPVRTVSPERISGAEARQAALTAFTNCGTATRAASKVFNGNATFVDVGSDTSTTDVWVGSDIPISANKYVVEGHRNRFARTPSEQRSIDVTIVCNESWMSEEAKSVKRYYTGHAELPFDPTIHEHLDTESLEALLETEIDFFHYVGHATADGLKCRDGYLDVSDVSSIGVETFFLNACQSYQQAIRLVKGGAIGGIATLSDVTDDQATIIGRTAARLLNLGYPLRKALDVARSRSVVGGQYLAVGDDGVTLAPSDDVPKRFLVTSCQEGYELTVTSYQTPRLGAGALYFPWGGTDDRQFLAGKTIGPFELSGEELQKMLDDTNVPVDFDGEFRWAFDLAEELD